MIEDILKVGLVSFAIVYLIRYTDGPFALFYWFRVKSGFIEYDDGTSEENNWFAEMIECYPCFTTWITLFVTLLAVKLDIVDTIVSWFASVGVSLVLWKFMRWSKE